MHRRRKHGIAEAIDEWPVSLFCCDLLYADGQDLTPAPPPGARPGWRRRSRRSRGCGWHRRAGPRPRGPGAVLRPAIADGCEGLLCKSLSPTAATRPGARGWLWIKLKRDYRTELSDTLDLVVVGRWPAGAAAGVYGALLLAAYDAEADLFRTVCKCGTGFSDAELAALPERLAPWPAPSPPARVDARMVADVWFEPGLVVEVSAPS
jgi:DNA ligase-1